MKEQDRQLMLNAKKVRLERERKEREYRQKYYEEHKDEIKEYNRQYSKLKYTCEVCKCELIKKHMKRHESSKKHLSKLDSQTP